MQTRKHKKDLDRSQRNNEKLEERIRELKMLIAQVEIHGGIGSLNQHFKTAPTQKSRGKPFSTNIHVNKLRASPPPSEQQISHKLKFKELNDTLLRKVNYFIIFLGSV